METNPDFNQYMDRYYDYLGQWESPSRCGLKIVNRSDGQLLAIATELYRQNPGTPVTEWCAPLATAIMKEFNASPERFIFIEHTPDLRSRLSFYGETFDRVTFQERDGNLFEPKWTRLTAAEVDALMTA